MGKRTRTCFVICPIGSPDSSTRKRSDKVLRHIIKPAAIEAGLAEPIRADQISQPGMITSQIIQRIVEGNPLSGGRLGAACHERAEATVL